MFSWHAPIPFFVYVSRFNSLAHLHTSPHLVPALTLTSGGSSTARESGKFPYQGPLSVPGLGVLAGVLVQSEMAHS